MSEIRTYRDLLVWQKSMLLVTQIYNLSNKFPQTEIYGLTSQIRRSGISIPSNIAEGYGRNATGDYKRFLQIALASLYELQTQLEITLNLNYLEKEHFDSVMEATYELERMLSSLINKIK
jgi:four helix bundle protein